MPPLFFSGRRGRRIGRRSLAGNHIVGEIDALVHLADHNLLIAMVTCGVRHTVQFGRRSLSPEPDEPDAARQLRAAPSTELVGSTVNSFPANAAPATGRHTMLKLVARASFISDSMRQRAVPWHPLCSADGRGMHYYVTGPTPVGRGDPQVSIAPVSLFHLP